MEPQNISGDASERDIFDPQIEHGSSHLGEQECEHVLNRLLKTHPDASVVAIGPDGLFRAMPPEVPLTRHTVISGHASALELVTPSDIEPVIDAWKRLLDQGAAMVDVHPLEGADLTMGIYFVDVRHRYDVVIGVIVHPEGSVTTSRGAQNLLRPRVTMMKKNNLSEIVEVDSAFEQILGYSRDELIGRRNLEFVHPDDHQRAIANYVDMLGAPGGSRQVRLRQLHRDGHWMWFEITNNNLLDDPDDPCVMAEMIDISEEMAAQEYLRASEQLLRRLTESLPVGVLQIDTDGGVIHRNAGVTQILHCISAENVTDAFAKVDPRDQGSLQAAISAATTSATDADLELSVLTEDDVRRCKVSLRALIGEDGTPTGVLICIDDVTEEARLREQLRDRATFDALTRCHNRASTLTAIGRALEEAKTADSGIAVIFIDLDGFKAVNDRRGHAAGDALLQKVAQCLARALRPHDLVGRFGGDEFVVLGCTVVSADEALALGERLARALAASITPEPPSRSVASIGVAWSDGSIDADTLIHDADGAMYLSKREGVGRPMMLGMSIEAAAS
ncbi:PAS domain S-box-containing protein/diguanylate cyclase (GGDEF) domain-containing protein [Frankineae bacterium MT45]|nr:PAS domain S-box-containing protein/diguanylate cyclase (GGDEF) domain-containing protein [Frankineae bacterium MT45]